MSRLSRQTLPRLRGVRLPSVDPGAVRVGVVHLGVGAFHRAHQAVYLEDADPAGEWGICGYTQRSAAVRDRLCPQDGLYTLLERGPGAAPPRVVGALREVHGPGPADRIADPRVRMVTLTVTEKGYRFAAGGGLDLADPAVAADLAGFGAPSRTAIGRLVAGLDLRRRGDGGPITVLSCDNLIANGAALRRLVGEFCAALPGAGEPLAAWIERSVRFPSSVVDRIVPTTRPEDLAEVERLLGVADAAAVVAEPFRQWVVEDDFAAGRPDLAAAGVLLVADVAPYEAMKLRLLNAAHSLLAYTGLLRGHATIAEALADPQLAEAAAGLMACDAAPTLAVPDGFDVAGYQRSVLRRFANPALGHRTAQVAADGSLKLPIRLLSTARARLARGGEPGWVALAVAAWMVHVVRRPDVVDDPLAPRLRAAVAGLDSPARVVDALLAVREVFGDDLPGDATFRRLLVEHTARLLRTTR